MNNYKVSIKGNYGPKREKNYLQVFVENKNRTVRTEKFGLEPGTSALAKQMNKNIWKKAAESIQVFKKEFDEGVWDNKEFYNRVV